MFIDKAKIYVKAGSGGKGCCSFYRDKFARQGIPDGGDGGKGADIIISADRNLQTLLDFQYRRHFLGLNGGHGSGRRKRGKDAASYVIRVPLGTLVRDARSNCLLRDLTVDQEEFIVARGGAGGLGNKPHRQASAGSPGEERELFLDLKLIADVALVGFPNAGKSSLINSISHAQAKIAAYPFTTTAPVLGVVKAGGRFFTVVDVPGLIEGSSAGRGLGDRFLRHIERTRLIVHIIDMAACDGRRPLEDYAVINREMRGYSEELLRKPQVIVANKMDLQGSAKNLRDFKRAVKKKVFAVSALKKEGLEELIEAIAKKL